MYDDPFEALTGGILFATLMQVAGYRRNAGSIAAYIRNNFGEWILSALLYASTVYLVDTYFGDYFEAFFDWLFGPE